ncbi:hypothetical protein COCC4DRAFT_133864 [Bipolaris maydis ATCC 48331]|uniref:Uncharacterized protein n=2 Tax=Cochliobolus heterostrophus TaxID=5016 RepID=M2UHA8_COCH5|nr:uncharacterized protein COCC4DRAFT_133864 [Bipolaris maydis ATCC 48331]EMD87353.1 hypothetical protein COCHEDRAFT_1112806 [Bipolaris maydis C5]ENI06551.1 hypothetical protein COCC4DRAFT_133864 [Bipolaris maydis ATCC 48331]KAJ6212240.1 hypothetical protein PSV09DRAFT_1112806 [Bipolaris maydis]
MSSRTGKRPLEPRPRGDSPPSKRNRAQEPRSALPDKARSLNTTSRPQEKPGRPDQVSSHDAPTRSPTYLGSRPSTPTHRNAPPAPSMLPVESNSHANSTPRLDNPTNGCAPITMQSLRKLRDRRLAVAAQFSPSGMPASSATQVEVSLEAQQLEVNQLKKERNELNSRLKNVEAVFQNSNRLTNFTEQQACSSKALQPLLTRLDVLEKSLLVPKDKTFQKEKDALVPVENRLAAVEVALSNLHERLEQIKHPSNQANASLAKAANNAVTKIFASENEIPTFINDRLKKLVADKVSEYAVDIKNSIGREMAEMEAQLSKRIIDEHQLLQNTLEKLKDMKDLSATNDDLSLMAITKALEDQVKTLQTEVDSLSDDFNETGQKLHEHSTAITLMKNQVPELFRQQFDPFKSKVQEQLGIVNGQLGAHANDIDSLKNVMSLLQTKTMSNTQALATKADADAVGTRTDSIMFALKDLEHRYQNISTDEMYQKMVHWFVQMYPASAALLRDTAQLQQDVKQLKSYCSDISWVWKRSEVLVDLCQNAGQLQWLAKNAPQLQALCRQHSPQVQGNVQQALVEVEQRLKIDINELKIMKNSLEPQMSQIAMQVADIQTSAYQHRRDFDTIKDTLIEPNKDFFGLFGTALAVLAQVQQVVEILNKSIPGSPLTLDWECYLPALVEQSKTNTNSGISAKGGNSMQ